MQNPSAIIFDCDGVLVDTEPIANALLSEMLIEHGVTMSAQECGETFIGLNPTGVGRKLLEVRGVDLREVLELYCSARFMDRIRAVGLTPIDGMGELVARLFERRMGVAAASNSPIDELVLKLELSKLDRWFGAHAYSGDALGTPKPQPGVYLHAAKQLGAAPRECVVVEDSPTGVRAGVAAGMRVIGFAAGTHSTPQLRQQLLDLGACAMCSDAAELARMVGV